MESLTLKIWAHSKGLGSMNIEGVFLSIFAFWEAPQGGGGTQSHNHAFISFSRIHGMRGKFGFSRNIAKIGLKMGHFTKSRRKNLVFTNSRWNFMLFTHHAWKSFHAFTQMFFRFHAGKKRSFTHHADLWGGLLYGYETSESRSTHLKR